MNASETELAKLLKSAEQAGKRWSAAEKRLSAAREQHADQCTHPVEFQQSFEWEHDNGYGRQHMRKGRRCGLCGKENRWPPLDGSSPATGWHSARDYAW